MMTDALDEIKGWKTQEELQEWEEMKEEEKVLFRNQVNYFIIEKLWEYCNKAKGDKRTKEYFYGLIGITENSYSMIRQGTKNIKYIKLKRKWECKNSKLKKLGLSKEFILGEKILKIGEIDIKKWKDYMNCRYKKIADTVSKKSYRKNDMREMLEKLEEVFDELKQNNNGNELERLYHYFLMDLDYGLDGNILDKEMQSLYDNLKNITIDNIKECDKELRKNIFDEMKEKYDWLNIIMKYEDLSAEK